MAGQTALIGTREGENQRLWTALEAVLRQFSIRFDCCLPAQVISYDRVNNVANVQPLIKIVKVDGTIISRHPIARVPVLALGGGGFVINFPIKVGDLGWIHAADRDLSLFLQALNEQAPNSTRAHRFDDCRFVPDQFRQYTISSEDNDAMVIQSLDSSTRIAIHQNGNVDIVAPGLLKVTCPNSEFTGNLTIDQNLTVKGNETIQGTSNIQGTLTNAGINITTHKHGGVQSGGSTTLGPQ